MTWQGSALDRLVYQRKADGSVDVTVRFKDQKEQCVLQLSTQVKEDFTVIIHALETAISDVIKASGGVAVGE